MSKRSLQNWRCYFVFFQVNGDKDEASASLALASACLKNAKITPVLKARGSGTR